MTQDAAKIRILDAARRLFGQKGYQSTSIADLLKEAEVHSGSLYYAFPTKQDVLLAVLQAYRDGIVPMLLDPAWAGVKDPLERVFALLAAYRHALEVTECTYGCPIGSLALELHEPDPPVRCLLADNFDVWSSHVERCLSEASEQLPAGTDLGRLASFVLTVMEGAVMQARVYRELDQFDRSVGVLRDYFDRLIEDAKAEKREEVE